MSNNNLSILVEATINEGASLGSINKSLKALSKKVNSLNIKINIDQSVLANLASLSKNLGNITQQINQQNIANAKNTQGINDQVKATNEAIAAEKRLGIEKERTNSKGVNTATYGNSKNNNKQIVTTLPDGAVQLAYSKNQLKDYQAVEKMGRDHFNAIITNKKMIADMEKVHYLALQKNRELDWKNLQVTNKQSESLDKAHYQALKQNSDMSAKNSQQTQSLINSAYSGKQSVNSPSSGVADAKALDILNRKYSETIAKLNEAKASGKQLTESELNGINRRITALGNLSTRQKQVEKERATLSATQLKAEVLVGNLTSRYGTKVDSAGLNSLLAQLNALNTTVPQFKAKAQSLVQQIQLIGSTARSTAVETGKLGSTFQNAFIRIAAFAGIGSLLYAPFRSIQSGLKYVYELDTALTDLQKVTDETTLTYDNFLQSARKTADSIGGVTLDVIKSTTEWARLGYTIQQAQQLAKQTIVYQNVGDIDSAEEASTALISAVKGFGLEVDVEGRNIAKVVDIYNEVGNKFAISSSGIGESLRRSSATMAQAGNTIEQTVALATAANSVIQNPATVGTGMKNISMRLQGISEDGEDLSNLIPTLEKKFSALGLTLKKDDKTFKSTYEIFESLSGVWSEMSQFQQSDIIESIAGKLQGNIASSILENWSDAEGALEAGLNSFGSAAKENTTFLDSMQGRVSIFKNSVTSFWTDTLNSEDVKVFIDTGTSLINTLAGVTSVFGGMGTAIGITTLALLTFNSTVKAATITKLSQSLATAGLQFKSLAWFTNLYTTSTVAARFATIALQATLTLGLSVAIAAVVSGISSLVQKNKENAASLQAAKEQNEQVANSWMKNSETIEGLIKQYDKLKTITKDGTVFSDIEQEKTYRDLIEQISGLMPNLVSSVDEKGDKHLKNAEAIKSEIEYTKTLVELQKQTLLNNARDDFQTNIDLIEASQKKLKEFEKDQDSAMEDGMAGMLIPGYGMDKIVEDMQTFRTAADINVLTTQNEIANQTDALKTQLQSMISTFLDLNNIKINESTSKVIQDMVDALDPTAIDSADKLVSAYQNISTAVALIGNGSKTDEEKVRLDNLLTVLNWTNKEVKLVSESFNVMEGSVASVVASTEDMAKEQDELNKKFNKSIDNIQTLYNSYDQLNKGEKLSLDTIQDLIKEYPDLIKYLENKNGVLTLSKEGIELVAKAEETRFKNDLEQQKIGLQTAQKTLTEKLALYGREVAALQELDKAGYLYSSGSIAEAEAREKEFNEYKGIIESIAGMDALIGTDFKKTARIENETKANDKNNDSQSDTVEILTDLQKALIDVKKATEDAANERDKMRKGSQEYRNSLDKENKLLQQQIDLRKEGIADPSKLVSTKRTTTIKSGDYSSSSSSSSSPSSGNKYSDLINKYASLNNVDPNLIAAIIKTESGFNSNATSGAGAAGLMQLMPGTAKGLGVKDSYNAEQNIAGGTKHFARLLKKYNGDAELALYAYNAGEGNVDKWIKNGKINNIPFAETKAYAPKVLSAYNGSATSTSSSDSGTTTTKNGGTTVKMDYATDKERQDAVDAAIEANEADLNTIYQNKLETLASVAYKYERLIAEKQAKIEESKKTQDTLDPNSVEWRKENEKQINIQSAIQKLNNEERSNLTSMMKALGIKSDEYDDVIKQLYTESRDIQSDKLLKVAANITSQIDSAKIVISEFGDKISLSEAKMSQFEEGTAEYNAELANQISLTNKQKDANQELITFIEKQLKNEQLSITKKMELKEQLKELILANYEYSNSIKEIKENYADGIIDDYKEMISKQKDFAIDAIDDQVDAEEKRHDERLKNIDEEKSKFEDAINAQIQLLDRSNVSDDFESSLNKQLKERQDIQDKINALSLDNSTEGKARKKSLEAEALIKDEEIGKFRLDRERELRKQNLSDQLDDHQDYVDQVKNQEDIAYDNFTKGVEDEKEQIEQKYDDMLNDEKKFYELKQGLMSSDKAVVQSTLSELQLGYDGFFASLSTHATNSVQEFENLNYTFTKMMNNLSGFTGLDSLVTDGSSVGIGGSSPTTSTPNTNSNDTPDARTAWASYLSNKKQAEDLRKQMESLNKSSSSYKSLESSFNSLKSQNDSLRSKYSFFPEGSYEALRSKNIFSAETGGMTPANIGKSGKFLLAHEKEIVLNKTDTSKFLEGINILRNINLPNLANLNKVMALNNKSQPTQNTSHDIFHIRIDKLNTDEQGVDSFLQRIVDTKKKKGM
jgi:TP901 family phage tail tape measure protein